MLEWMMVSRLEFDDPEANTVHLYTFLRGVDKLVVVIPNAVTVPSNSAQLSVVCGVGNGVRGPQVSVFRGHGFAPPHYPHNHSSFR